VLVIAGRRIGRPRNASQSRVGVECADGLTIVPLTQEQKKRRTMDKASSQRDPSVSFSQMCWAVTNVSSKTSMNALQLVQREIGQYPLLGAVS
jgi:hypothetical protein